MPVIEFKRPEEPVEEPTDEIKAAMEAARLRMEKVAAARKTRNAQVAYDFKLKPKKK